MQPSEAHQRRDEFRFLDVREPAEWRAGHIEAAVHLPMAQVPARQDDLPNDRPIVVVCRSGTRSDRVATALKRAGFEVHNLEGGMQAWDRAGLPYVSDDETPPRIA